ARLWSWLRNRRFGDYKFRRQHPIGNYVVDFYCRELKLVIELDGAKHYSADGNEYDTARTLVLQTYGICVIRISNELLIRDALTAAQCIEAAIERLRSRAR
ncbi:MAG TPA: endonuclease domain-containing protein, partial [Thermoanaerobaculia bacterium]|nr:endonuclease domain-containing protein [Thermoanaerobaculia bacterium]